MCQDAVAVPSGAGCVPAGSFQLGVGALAVGSEMHRLMALGGRAPSPLNARSGEEASLVGAEHVRLCMCTDAI